MTDVPDLFPGFADEADHKAGKRIACPTLVLWGTDYVGKTVDSPLQVWQSRCTRLTGEEIVSGRFLAEENPAATLAALLPFLRTGDTDA